MNATALRTCLGPARILLFVILATVVVGILVGAGISKWYWGFAFARPAVDARVRDATRVRSYTNLDVYPDADTGVSTGRNGPPSVADVREAGRREGGHYHLGTRIAGALHARGLLASPPSRLTDARLAAFVPTALARVRRRLDPRDAGDWTFGTLVELDGPAGEPLVVLCGQSHEVSNDHFAYYEFVFAGTVTDAAPLSSANRFYFDVAGIEGKTWRDFAIAATIAGLAIVVPATLFFIAVRALRSRRAARRRGFAVDLP